LKISLPENLTYETDKTNKRAKKTEHKARRVEQGGFTSQKTEKNHKVPERYILKITGLDQSYFEMSVMR
jgi:hypothetical protein